MLTETFRSISAAVRTLLKSWKSLVVFAIVYGALLGTVYFFMVIREASVVQVVLTFALAIVAFVLFFLLQAMVVGGITTEQTHGETGIPTLLKSSLANLGKLVAISLPLIALAVLIAYLLGKVQNYFGVGADSTNNMLEPLAGSRSRKPAQPPINWRVAIFSSLRYLSFGLLLPLATIHLWLAAARDGLGSSLKRIGTHLSNAFAPQSVLIYILGFLVFGLLPYLVLFKTTPTSKAWLEIALFVIRLAAVFALTLCGWVITVWALSVSSAPSPASTTSTAPSPSPEPAKEAA